MWHENIDSLDLLDLLRITRERVRRSHMLVRELEQTYSQTMDIIRKSELTILETDEFLQLHRACFSAGPAALPEPPDTEAAKPAETERV